MIALLNQVFGRLFVVAFVEKDKWAHNKWLCRCVCGNLVIVKQSCLKQRLTKSCGCLGEEVSRINGRKNRKHGYAGTHGHNTPTYMSWRQMHQRCKNPNNASFSNYGGRGITVCERWKDFRNFLVDMGERPLNTSIDRINNDGNYEPNNYRWATSKEQSLNKRKRKKYRKHQESLRS